MRYVTAQEIKNLLESQNIYNAVGNISINLNNTSVTIKQNVGVCETPQAA